MNLLDRKSQVVLIQTGLPAYVLAGEHGDGMGDWEGTGVFVVFALEHRREILEKQSSGTRRIRLVGGIFVVWVDLVGIGVR